MAEIPININKSKISPRSVWPQRLMITAIMILLVLNAGAVYFIYYKSKVLAESAEDAATNAQTFSGFGQGKALPAADVAGEDVSPLGKYKGSVRTAYQKTDNKVTVEYQTKDSPQAVLTFYKNLLAYNNDWVLEESTVDHITFSKDGSFVTVSASASENKSDKITTIKIVS